MRQMLFLLFLSCIIVGSCKSDAEKISRRWVITDLQTPSSKAMSKAFDASYLEGMNNDLKKSIQGNRLILNPGGSCFGVLLNRYFTGRWDYKEADKAVYTHIDFPAPLDLKWQVVKQGAGKLDLEIEANRFWQLKSLSEDSLVGAASGFLDETGSYTLTAEAEDYDFSEEEPDPFSPELNTWRLKPAAPETPAALRARARNHLEFVYGFFSFITRKERFWVSQYWFTSVIKPASNGIALVTVKNIPESWYQCFYDSVQAMQGYKEIRDAFHADIKVPDESNSYLFNKLMLGKVLEAFDKQDAAAKN